MKKRTTFLMQFDWYEMIELLNTEQKASLLDAIYQYQLYGEIADVDPMVRLVLTPMFTFFKGAEEDYNKKCIKNSLNRHKGWTEKDGDETKLAIIEEQTRFLEEHNSKEFTNAYDAIGSYTNVKDATEGYTKNTYTDTNTSSSPNNNVSSKSHTESNTDSQSYIGFNTDSDGEGVQRERKEVTLEELQRFHDEFGYTFDCRSLYRAKAKPLYEDELVSQCDRWESLVRR